MKTVAGRLARVAIAASVAFVLGAASASANTFTDGTLSTYTGNNATSPVWKERGNGSALTSVGGAAQIANTLFSGLFQSFTVAANTAYSVSFQLKLTSRNAANPLYAFSAFATSNFTGGTDLFATLSNIKLVFTNLNAPSSSFQTYSYQFQSGSSGNVAVGFGGSIGGQGNLQFDNITVQAVPGPVLGAGLPALLGLFGYRWLARRRGSATA